MEPTKHVHCPSCGAAVEDLNAHADTVHQLPMSAALVLLTCTIMVCIGVAFVITNLGLQMAGLPHIK